MELIYGRAAGAECRQREGTATGAVWGTSVLPTTDGVTINTVYFAPGARTYWHRHGGGQLLRVANGHGWVGLRGQAAEPMREGDLVWAAPGEEHWHGAKGDAFLVHLAVSLGNTEWLEEVVAADVSAATGRHGDRGLTGHEGMQR